MIIIDEAQEVLADHDEEFPAIVRSLGLALCYGTQTLDQFIERLKGKTEDRAFGFFEQFRSFMTSKSSKATYMMLLGVLVRPPLMVVGFMCAVVIMPLVGSLAGLTKDGRKAPAFRHGDIRPCPSARKIS